MKTIAVVTALNEEPTIGALVAGLLEYCDDVIVIDDGSADETGSAAFISGAKITTHAQAHGIASSLTDAWILALSDGADKIVQIDAGGSHSVKDLPRMLLSSADVVIGSRFVPGAQYIGGYRKYFSRAYAALCNWAIGGYVASDWTSGYRVFTRRALEVLLQQPPYWTDGHAWQAEVLHRAIRRRLSVAECPITYTAGRSSMKWHNLDDALMVLLKVMTV